MTVGYEDFQGGTSISKVQRNIFESWLTPLYQAASLSQPILHHIQNKKSSEKKN